MPYGLRPLERRSVHALVFWRGSLPGFQTRTPTVRSRQRSSLTPTASCDSHRADLNTWHVRRENRFYPLVKSRFLQAETPSGSPITPPATVPKRNHGLTSLPLSIEFPLCIPGLSPHPSRFGSAPGAGNGISSRMAGLFVTFAARTFPRNGISMPDRGRFVALPRERFGGACGEDTNRERMTEGNGVDSGIPRLGQREACDSLTAREDIHENHSHLRSVAQDAPRRLRSAR
jgi:hypothetical protein